MGDAALVDFDWTRARPQCPNIPNASPKLLNPPTHLQVEKTPFTKLPAKCYEKKPSSGALFNVLDSHAPSSPLVLASLIDHSSHSLLQNR